MTTVTARPVASNAALREIGGRLSKLSYRDAIKAGEIMEQAMADASLDAGETELLMLFASKLEEA